MKNTYIFCSIVPLVLCIQISLAQDKDSAAAKKESYWQAGVNYLSDNIFNGRKDSVRLPYASASLGFYHKSGLYINSSAAYLTNESRFDRFTIEAGYQFAVNKFNGSISAEKSFYSSQSTSVTSEILGSVNAYGAVDLSFITPSLNISADFGSKADIGMSLGLEHSFSAFADKMDISPQVLANAGTQNYYDNYYNKRRYARKRNVYYDITANVPDASSFKILDYELTVPVTFASGKFTFSFTPVYAIPVNPTEVVLTIKSSGGGTTTKKATEKLDNSFFWSAGVAYRL